MKKKKSFPLRVFQTPYAWAIYRGIDLLIAAIASYLYLSTSNKGLAENLNLVGMVFHTAFLLQVLYNTINLVIKRPKVNMKKIGINIVLIIVLFAAYEFLKNYYSQSPYNF